MLSSSLIFVAKHVYEEALCYISEELRGKICNKANVIYAWINIEEIRKQVLNHSNCKELKSIKGKDKLVFGYVGRMFFVKGINFALKAYNIIVNEMKLRNTEFWVFGEGPMKSWVRRFAKKHKLENKLKDRNEVIAELLQENLKLKKDLGEI